MPTYPTPLTPNTFQVALQAATLAALGRTPPYSVTDFTFVRVDWQQQGQPTWGIGDDVVLLRGVEEDSEYNRVRDVDTLADTGTTVTQLTKYTRVWLTHWCLYGPNSFDNARILRSSLFLQSTHDLLAGSNLYFVTDPAAPVRAPEYFAGQWWERVDFEARFNEAVYEAPTVPSVASAEIIVENADGIVANIEVE